MRSMFLRFSRFFLPLLLAVPASAQIVSPPPAAPHVETPVTNAYKVTLQPTGGYSNTDGTANNLCPADNVEVVVVDTTPSIIAGDVQYCGYVSYAAYGAGTVTCELVDISGGAGTYTTTGTFWLTATIKAVSVSVLGGAGDETLTVRWAAKHLNGCDDNNNGPIDEGAERTIRTVTNLVNSAASDYATSPVVPVLDGGPIVTITVECADAAGCRVAFAETAAEDGFHIYTIAAGTNPLDIADVDGQQDLTGDADISVIAKDVICLLYSAEHSAWLQSCAALQGT